MLNPGLSLEGRHEIGTGTRVSDGVFFGRAAYVVDRTENPKPYDLAYFAMQASLSKPETGQIIPVIQAMRRAVRFAMPYEPSKMAEALKQEALGKGKTWLDRGDIVAVSAMADARGGNCQFVALFGATLLEMHEDEHGIGGLAEVRTTPGTDTTRTTIIGYILNGCSVNIYDCHQQKIITPTPVLR